jgi:subtilase family serine protease
LAVVAIIASLTVTLLASLDLSPALKSTDPLIVPASAVSDAPPLGGYSPQQIRHAYGIDQLPFDGAGQTIAIVSAYDAPAAAYDLQLFSHRYNLPLSTDGSQSTCAARNLRHPCFAKIALTDSPSYQEDWALDSTMSVEWAHAVAPGADILLVLAERASFDALLSGVDHAVARGARIVVMDWSSPEFPGEINYDRHFAVPGVSFVAAAGDRPEVVGYPAASPRVLAVGGTTMLLNSDGTIRQEQPWSGTGWGASQHERAMPYQSDGRCASAAGRVVPDVSYSADPRFGYAVFSSTARYGRDGWFRLGGTSAGAPQWAALLALANQAGAAPAGVAFDAVARLYALADLQASDRVFRTIVGYGTTDACSAPNATLRFAPTTGLGSPIANRLIGVLARRP